MDTNIAEIKASLARIDERTTAILTHQEAFADAMVAHQKDNRSDFRGVHGRINKIEKKQSWMIGIGTAVMSMVTGVGGFFGFGG